MMCFSTICAPFKMGMALTCRMRGHHEIHEWTGDGGRITWTSDLENPALTSRARLWEEKYRARVAASAKGATG
jgi:hypothetical protein